MKKERFALVYRTLHPVALAYSKNRARRARFGVRRYCAAFLLLSTIGYLSAVAAAKADQPSTLAQAPAQLAPIHKQPFNEPLEKYNMPPAPPRKIETSPRMISQFGVFTSFQANVDASGNNILGDCANEPSISVDPTNGNKMMIAWRQFNSINSDFRQAGWGYTSDGGVHWTFP